MHKFAYDIQKTFDERLAEAEKILKKENNKLPVLFEFTDHNNERMKLQKNKFALDRTITVGEMVLIVRNRIEVESYKGLYLYIEFDKKVIILSNNSLIGDLYDKYRGFDKFLKIHYDVEPMFG